MSRCSVTITLSSHSVMLEALVGNVIVMGIVSTKWNSSLRNKIILRINSEQELKKNLYCLCACVLPLTLKYINENIFRYFSYIV